MNIEEMFENDYQNGKRILIKFENGVGRVLKGMVNSINVNKVEEVMRNYSTCDLVELVFPDESDLFPLNNEEDFDKLYNILNDLGNSPVKRD